MSLPSALLFSLLVASVSMPAMAAKPTLKDLVVPDMLGVTLAYFQQEAGPPKYDYGDRQIYKIGKCELSVNTKGGKVNSFEVDLSPACSFDLYAFLPNYTGPKHPVSNLTMGQFDAITRGQGRWHPSCLRGCGNAADPVVNLRWTGSRADDFLEVEATISTAVTEVLTASNKWEELMIADRGERWVEQGKFNCGNAIDKYVPAARKLFKDMKVNSLTVGHDLYPIMCG